jgi:hypothetical protein
MNLVRRYTDDDGDRHIAVGVPGVLEIDVTLDNDPGGHRAWAPALSPAS